VKNREIATVRRGLGLTQAQLAGLLGVHWMTVSRWERGTLVPTAWQQAMLATLAQAQAHDEGAGQQALLLAQQQSIMAALAFLFQVAFEESV